MIQIGPLIRPGACLVDCGLAKVAELQILESCEIWGTRRMCWTPCSIAREGNKRRSGACRSLGKAHHQAEVGAALAANEFLAVALRLSGSDLTFPRDKYVLQTAHQEIEAEGKETNDYDAHDHDVAR